MLKLNCVSQRVKTGGTQDQDHISGERRYSDSFSNLICDIAGRGFEFFI